MVGYIVLNDDMSGIDNDTIFELGKWYEIIGETFSTQNGFLVYEKPEDIVKFQPIKGNRFFKVETDGEVFQEGEYFVAKKIRLIEEIPATEKMIKTLNYVGKVLGFLGIVFTMLVPMLIWMISNADQKLNAFAMFGFFLILAMFGILILFCFLNFAFFYTSKKQYQKYLEDFNFLKKGGD